MKNLYYFIFCSLALCAFSNGHADQNNRMELAKCKKIADGVYTAHGVNIPVPANAVECKDLSYQLDDGAHVTFYGPEHILGTVVVLPVQDGMEDIFKTPSEKLYGLMEHLTEITVIKDLKQGNQRFEVVGSENLAIDGIPAYFFLAKTPKSSKFMDPKTKMTLATYTGGLFIVKNGYFINVIADTIDYEPILELGNQIAFEEIAKKQLLKSTKAILKTIKF